MAGAQEDEFGKELASAWADDEASSAPEPPKAAEPVVAAPEPPKVEEPKADEPAKPKVPKEGEPASPPADPANPAQEDPAAPKAPETPPAAEEPKPLTKEDVTGIIQNIRTEERTSLQELRNTTDDVMEAYYPEGLSNVLVDQGSGKELRTPQDVVDASNGEMTVEDAAQWLMNEQYKLDKSISEIKASAEKIAETTISFKRDSVAALQKYEPLFKAYPTLQSKVFNKLMENVKADEKKGVITSAPDVMSHYDFYLEPYQQAYEYATKQSATAPVTAPAAPAPPTPGINDRMDEGGDGGNTAPNDPNDFAQQVSKELSKGF